MQIWITPDVCVGTRGMFGSAFGSPSVSSDGRLGKPSSSSVGFVRHLEKKGLILFVPIDEPDLIRHGIIEGNGSKADQKKKKNYLSGNSILGRMWLVHPQGNYQVQFQY